jgi:dGTPase
MMQKDHAERWLTLLSPKRLSSPYNEDAKCNFNAPAGRDSFEQDRDLIVFSASFRKLQNKTQVHPLPTSDHVHNRLTHSVEVSSVGRSLGNAVGHAIIENDSQGLLAKNGISYHTFNSIIQAASLAHDIGNPPFGHSAEDSIQEWFKSDVGHPHMKHLSKEQREDLYNFEGNAQGFRILTQLENRKFDGGLRLTYAMLSTFLKYPTPAHLCPPKDKRITSNKKNGYFLAEKHYLEAMQSELNLPLTSKEGLCLVRHPLTYLVEAADDICYTTIDIEDAYLLGDIDFIKARELLSQFLPEPPMQKGSNDEFISYLRASAIGYLIPEVSKAFLANQTAMIEGTFMNELLAETCHSEAIKFIKSESSRLIYNAERKILLELSGEKAIHDLLDIFTSILPELHTNGWDEDGIAKKKSRKLLRILNNNFTNEHFSYFENVKSMPKEDQYYHALLRITDFISSMTDKYTIKLHKTLMGI